MVEWRPEWKPRKVTHSLVMTREDLDAYPCWYLDAAHCIPPWTPLFAWTWTHHLLYGILWATETIGLPRCRGLDLREIDGCVYQSPVLVTDEQEIQQREARFRENLRPFLEDYDRVWGEVVKELTEHFDRFKAFDVNSAPNYELYDHFEKVFHFNYRVWALHFWMMYPVYAIYALFEDLCREQLGIDDTSPFWHRLVRGFDNKLFEVDRQLWRLYERALELGIGSIFKTTQDSEVVRALGDTESGKKWLDEPGGLRQFLIEHGWRMPRMMEFNCKAWIEDPTPVIGFIKQYMTKGGAFEMDVRRPELIEQRREAEQEVLSRFPEAERGWVTRLMGAAQRAGSFSEEHDYYFEHTAHSLMRRAGLACGARMASQGLVDDAEDFVYLLPEEIMKNIIPLRLDYHKLVSERKKYYREYSQRLPRPALIGRLASDPQAAMEHMLASQDPVMMKITVGVAAKVQAKLEADLYGNPGAPGIAEGPAHLVISEADISNIQPGEILVATTTYSSWTPVFPLLKGIVLDSGASLSHAAIVGREYNIPVVIQTTNATTQIRNGQRLRIDGSQGAVWILSE